MIEPGYCLFARREENKWDAVDSVPPDDTGERQLIRVSIISIYKTVVRLNIERSWQSVANEQHSQRIGKLNFGRS